MSLFDFGEAAPSKAYDLGYGHLGNGVTVWNRLEEEHGDYKTVAHIAPDRTVTIYDEDMAQAVREEIQRIADSSEMTISATQDAPVFTVPPRAQEPPQKEQPADPYPELAAQVLRFVGEFDGSRMDYGQDDAQAVENIAQQLHDPVQREEIRRLIQSFLDHADPEEEIAVDITLCMEQIAELPTALTPEQAQIEEIAGYLEEAGYAASSELVEEGLMDYRAHGGKGNSQDVADFIEREFLSEEPELASLEIAKEFINDFCVAEYGSPADFSDLEKVGIAYTTVTDEEIPIQVNADLVHYRIERYLDGQFLERRQYESLDELIQNELAELDFDDLISVSDGELESIGATPEQGSDGYFLLSRLKADCDYFLGAGGRAEKHLWAGNVREQIAKMRELYVALPDELEWLTMEDIDRYAQHMEPPFEVVVYHHFENGFDERLDYQTLAEAEQAAQKYVAGTMEGEDGFAYDGAGIYDLQENRWLRVYGNFPDERAIEQSAQALADEQQIENEPVQTNVEEPAVYEDLVGKELTMVGHRFVVERVSDVSDDVTLRDVTFEGNVGFPISRVEKVARVRELLQEQEQAQPQKEESLPPPPVGREKFSPTVLHPEISPEQRHNFRITDDHLGEGGAKTKFHNNVAAIQTLKQVEAEGRLATSEEQEILSRYVGWGGLPQAFDGDNSQWAEEFAELKGLLSPEEYEAAKATTLNAHYTSPTVIQAIYQAVENMGFRTGNFLEPSCGIGNFFGLVPESMKDSRLYGVELDSLTGRIAQQLYQQSSIAVQGFEDTELPDSFFDLAIGNVPFGSYSLHDKRYDKYHFLIHDYFFAKTLDKVRPGGIVAFITSKGTLDKQNPSVRKYIAERAELIGAIRLPNNAFLANAGTQVTTDILFLQKREKLVDVSLPDSGLEWLHLGQTEDGVPVNQYFIDHPEMMLGRMAFDRSMYGNEKETTCQPLEGAGLADLLEKAVENLRAQYTPYEMEEREDEDNSIPADPDVRNFSYTVVDGQVYYRENSRMFPVEASVTAENRIRGMIAIRDCARNLLEIQMENGSEEAVQAGQRELNRLYDSFTAQYGLLNSRANTSVFSADSSFPLLCSLEVLDEQGNLKRKADLFTKRTIQPYRAVTHVDTASEALAVSIGEKARVDLGYMASLTGKTQEQLAEELRGVIFPVPGEVGTNGKPHYVTADEYLSGNVREKLRQARAAAEAGSTYATNVEALEKVQPKDLTAGEINVRLGATWIPENVAEQFTHELLQTPFYYKSRIRVRYSPVTGEWNVSEKSLDRSNIRVFNTYGTKRVNAYKLIEDTLNLRDVRVFDTVQDENGKEQRVLNKKETAIAQDKQDQIKEKFQEWVWADPARRERLCGLYNEKFNAIRPREYDGSHLVFAGMNPEITLRPHQRNAVARAIYGGNALFAHVVGAGKTYEMIAAAMESKRLGLSSKALFVVPNHIIGDFASDFLDLYPGANILVATKKDFEKQRRKKFCARIATGDYDGIILGHSQFEKIPLSPERQQAMLKKQIAEVVAGIQAAKQQEGSRFTVKQMERSKKSLETKLKKLNDQSAKDDVVTFEELGVDRLFIDEADLFKNLYLYTKMRNVGGISQTESLKASDLYMKCQYMDELTGSKGVVFATGTPVSNSMAELYTMQRYLQGNLLKELGLSHFDAWASQFGETVTSMELKPEGQGFQQKTRFSNFYNLPELMALFKEVADIQTADMLNLPVPKAKYETVVCKPSDIQKEMVEALGQRADAVRAGKVDASKDNMLLITNDGRKLALDQRLLNPLLPDVEGSKVNVCAEKVYQIWKDTRVQRLTQLVFCDLSTPKSDGTFSVYNDLKDKLVGCGIPEEEIAFVHSAANETQKQQLFGKVRAGQVRVLLGSTAKMGAGTNVQDRLIALHDLDCPWRPRDLEQRSGRIIRQGNQNPEVQIYRYVTEGTFDSYLYQMVENKQRFISQVFTSKAPARVMQEIDDVVLSYNEIKALATGNPQIIERANLETEVNKLKMLRASFLSQKYELEDKVLKYYPQQIQQYEERIAGTTADIARRDQNTVTGGEYTGQPVEGTVSEVKAGTLTVPEDSYEVSYVNNVNAGTAVAIITAKANSNFTGMVPETFIITPKQLTSQMVSDIVDQPYTGNQITPTVTVEDDSTPLVEGRDFTVTYGDNDTVGTDAGTVTIKGSGNYAGKVEVSFNITNTGAFKVIVDNSEHTYNGSAHTPSVVVYAVDEDGVMTPLVAGTDYEVFYADNTDAGVASVTVTGKGAYTESGKSWKDTTAYFTIQPAEQSVTFAGVTDDKAEKTYGDPTFEQAATVTLNPVVGGQTPGTVTYTSSNPAVATVDSDGKVTIVGAGTTTITASAAATQNYKGAEVSYTLTVKPKDINSEDVTASKIPDQPYGGIPVTPEFSLTDSDPDISKNNLKVNVDYTFSYSNNNGEGEGKITITGTGNYTGTKEVTFKIIPWSESQVVVTPAPITIYMGGADGYEHVIVDEDTGEIKASSSLPEPGFLFDLPDMLEEALKANGDSLTDIKFYELASSKAWTVAPYAKGSSTVYRLVPGAGQEPVRVQFINAQGETVTEDQFDVGRNVNQELTMTLYKGKVGVINAIYDGVQYPIQLGESTLTVRGVTDEAQYATVTDGTTAPEAGKPAVAADSDTTYTINGSNVQVADESGVALLYDSIIDANGEDRTSLLEDKAGDALAGMGQTPGEGNRFAYSFQYLDLVDTNNGNAWVKASKDVTIYWPYPAGTNKDTAFTLLHFEGLHRSMAADDIAGQIENCTVSKVSIEDKTETHIVLKVGSAGFSPFALVWEEKIPTPPPVNPNPPADPDDTGVSSLLETKEHIQYLAGYPDNSFGPGRNMTRAEAAQMFYNLLVDKEVKITTTFEDVPENAWYATPVNTLASLGIISGVGDNRFEPDRSITRAEFTALAMKFTVGAEKEENIFSDVKPTDWFYEAVTGSIQFGWINGYGDGTFRPNNTITRAEVTAIVNKMLGREGDQAFIQQHQEELKRFTDVTSAHWAYYHIAEATNEHDYTKQGNCEKWSSSSYEK